MANDRIEYIFKCECRRSDFVYQNKSKKLKVCPIHKTRMEYKIRWCSICGAETICSTYSNSKKFVCSKCRRTNSLAVKRVRKKRRDRVSTGFRANMGIKHNPELEIPLAVRLLKKKFPMLPAPELSPEMKKVYEFAKNK